MLISRLPHCLAKQSPSAPDPLSSSEMDHSSVGPMIGARSLSCHSPPATSLKSSHSRLALIPPYPTTPALAVTLRTFQSTGPGEHKTTSRLMVLTRIRLEATAPCLLPCRPLKRFRRSTYRHSFTTRRLVDRVVAICSRSQ